MNEPWVCERARVGVGVLAWGTDRRAWVVREIVWLFRGWVE